MKNVPLQADSHSFYHFRQDACTKKEPVYVSCFDNRRETRVKKGDWVEWERKKEDMVRNTPKLSTAQIRGKGAKKHYEVSG